MIRFPDRLQIMTVVLAHVIGKPRIEVCRKITVPVAWQIMSQVDPCGFPAVGQRFSPLLRMELKEWHLS